VEALDDDGQPSGVVIAGNHQLAAAKKLGWDSIAVVWTYDDDLTAKAYALADNKTGELGDYDDDALAHLLADLTVDESLLAATGFTSREISHLLGENVGIDYGGGEKSSITCPSCGYEWNDKH
jgi:ParB-like chromosome segregation protein Spo0J